MNEAHEEEGVFLFREIKVITSSIIILRIEGIFVESF